MPHLACASAALCVTAIGTCGLSAERRAVLLCLAVVAGLLLTA